MESQSPPGALASAFITTIAFAIFAVVWTIPVALILNHVVFHVVPTLTALLAVAALGIMVMLITVAALLRTQERVATVPEDAACGAPAAAPQDHSTRRRPRRMRPMR